MKLVIFILVLTKQKRGFVLDFPGVLSTLSVFDSVGEAPLSCTRQLFIVCNHAVFSIEAPIYNQVREEFVCFTILGDPPINTRYPELLHFRWKTKAGSLFYPLMIKTRHTQLRRHDAVRRINFREGYPGEGRTHSQLRGVS